MPSAEPKTLVSRAKLGNKRVTGKEQFYTPVDLASRLTGVLVGLVSDFENHTIVEPAGGTGAFVEAAKACGATDILAFDIEPRHALVKKADFLATKIRAKNAITISNPPFGRNNALSIPFFNHAADSSDYIAFLVPRSWRKWSVINRIDRRFHLIHDEDLQIDYVDRHGELINEKNRLKTCFQIWQKRDELRPITKVQDHGLVTKTTPELADVSLTIFGYGCGRVRTDFERKPNSTSMFLKLNHPKALESLRSANFEKFFKNTAYTEALSLQEINYLLNEQILGDPHLELLSN